MRSAHRLSEIVRDRFPAWDAMPHVVRVATVAILRWLTRMDDIEALLASHAQKHGAAFIDGFFSDLGFSYVVSSCDKAHIPPKGRLVIVANHPLGALDALAVLRAVLDVRPDVRVVVNELLMDVGGLAGHFLPLDMFAAGPRKSHVLSMGRVLEQDSALLIFPLATSTLTLRGLRDRSWFVGRAPRV